MAVLILAPTISETTQQSQFNLYQMTILPKYFLKAILLNHLIQLWKIFNHFQNCFLENVFGIARALYQKRSMSVIAWFNFQMQTSHFSKFNLIFLGSWQTCEFPVL